MSEETWHAARLIPTSGINGPEEQERRGTSALLAVLVAVKEFGRGITGRLGAPAGTVECYIEVPFILGDKRLYPDGLIRVRRGAKSWTALVEVKTGSNNLQSDQLEAYLDVAKEQGFDALLTISNELPAVPGTHPTTLDKRKLKKVAVHHLPWSEILAEAQVQKTHRGVADPDQAWILGELIRYLEHPRSGALEFNDMGPSWVGVRESVSAGTLRAADKAAADVAGRWDSLIRFASLQLGKDVGTEVTPALSRKELADPAARNQAVVSGLVTGGRMEGGIRIPGAIGTLAIVADLRAGQISASVDVDAPKEGRPTTRVNWLVRQLKDAPDGLRIDATTAYSRGSTSALLKDVRADPSVLVSDPSKELRSFRVTLTVPMGTKRGLGRGAFITSVLEMADVFYGDVVQKLKAWSARPPKLREPSPDEISEPGVARALVSTALSSQDGVATDTPPAEAAAGSAQA
ncbi:MAG: hypothetical protein JWM67_2280 [Mycobacterium sp.]|nr:hypothetical protein [Mycobacterium sp.]